MDTTIISIKTHVGNDVLFGYLEEGPMYFDEDTVTDQPERQIAAEMIREKALRNLSDEVPHGIAVTIEKMHERPGGHLIDIEATIICERDSHKGIIIGRTMLPVASVFPAPPTAAPTVSAVMTTLFSTALPESEMPPVTAPPTSPP